MGRWVHLAAAVAVMMVIGIYQYSWFLFSFRIHQDLHWDPVTLGLVYTVYHYTSTLVMPFSGYIADRYGPRPVSSVGAALVGIGFILCASFPTQGSMLASYALGGIGGGILYGVSTATAVKWFPERRGLATGCAVFGFGAGSALFNLAIEDSLATRGLERTFLVLGVAMLAVLLPLVQTYRYPAVPATTATAGTPPPSTLVEFSPRQMVTTRQWYVIYISFSVTISVVLVFAAQMKLLAAQYGLPAGHFRALLVAFPLANGFSRLLAGAASDRFGRARTMQVCFSLLGVTMAALVWLGETPALFVLFVILAALFGGAPFTLYPAIVSDFYGQRYFTTNYGITYTAKAWAGLISGMGSGYLIARFGSFTVPLLLLGACSLAAALAAHPRFLSAPASKAVAA
jgi:OFA family oxalate/formate antiporter-like MFS transporter